MGIAYVKYGDNIPDLTTTIKDCTTNLPVDLTTATSASIRITPAAGGPAAVNAVATILSPPTSGRLQYTWAGPALAVGSYYIEWNVVYTALNKTYPSNNYNLLVVVPRLAA